MIPFIKSTQNKFGMSIIYHIISVRSTLNNFNLEEIKKAEVPLPILAFLCLMAGGCIFTIIFLWYKTPKIEDVIDELDSSVEDDLNKKRKDIINEYEQKFDEQLEIGNNLINQLNDPSTKKNKELLEEIGTKLSNKRKEIKKLLKDFVTELNKVLPDKKGKKHSVLEKAQEIRNKVADFQKNANEAIIDSSSK